MKYFKHNTNTIEASESDYLYTGLSQLPNSGNGLFTAISIYKDEVISLFKGEILTDLQAKLRAKKGNDKAVNVAVQGRLRAVAGNADRVIIPWNDAELLAV